MHPIIHSSVFIHIIKKISDGSDETTENCITTTCPKYAFRCAYGACVAGNAECNRKIECIGKKKKIHGRY